MKRSMWRITDRAKFKSLAAALVILKPLIDIDAAYIDASHFSDAEREKFNKALFDLGQAIQESLKLSQRGKGEELIAQIRLACNAHLRAMTIHPLATKHRLGRKQTAEGRKRRSTKSEAGRSLVYAHLDQLSSQGSDLLDKAPDAIAKDILPDLQTKLKDVPEKKRPRLSARSTVSKYVKEYRRRVK